MARSGASKLAVKAAALYCLQARVQGPLAWLQETRMSHRHKIEVGTKEQLELSTG